MKIVNYSLMEAIGAETNAVYDIKTAPKCLMQHVEDVVQLFIQALNSEE